MFQTFIKNIKKFFNSLDDEDKFILGSSIGLVFLGFLIYLTWQTRLIDPDEPTENAQEEIEESTENNNEEHDDGGGDDEGEDEVIENDQHGYQIVNIADQINEKEEAKIFGLKEPSDFVIEYKGVTHAVFENEDDLSLEEWIKEKIDEKGPDGESEEDQKSFLDIVLDREVETDLGSGREIVRMNGQQSGELFISRNDYIFSFYYDVESAREVSNMEDIRNKLIENIEE